MRHRPLQPDGTTPRACRFGGRRVIALLVVAAVTAIPAGRSPAAAGPLKSGREVGQRVPSFYVRAVTGPLRNRSVCYVCRNGSRPVVMILFRRLDGGLVPLLKQVETLIDRNRAEGLRGFGVMISDEPSGGVSKVQTLAFDRKISSGLPLTVSTDAVASPSCQNVHREAAITVVLYRRQRVVKTYAFRAGEPTAAQVRSVIASARRLLKTS